MKNQKPIRRPIKLRQAKGEVEVPATVYGGWAVHRGIADQCRQWVVTHVRSGMRIPEFYTEMLTKRTAMRVARCLNDELGDPGSESVMSIAFGKRSAEIIWREITARGRPA